MSCSCYPSYPHFEHMLSPLLSQLKQCSEVVPVIPIVFRLTSCYPNSTSIVVNSGYSHLVTINHYYQPLFTITTCLTTFFHNLSYSYN